jgi:hypothetical protein
VETRCNAPPSLTLCMHAFGSRRTLPEPQQLGIESDCRMFTILQVKLCFLRSILDPHDSISIDHKYGNITTKNAVDRIWAVINGPPGPHRDLGPSRPSVAPTGLDWRAAGLKGEVGLVMRDLRRQDADEELTGMYLQRVSHHKSHLPLLPNHLATDNICRYPWRCFQGPAPI